MPTTLVDTFDSWIGAFQTKSNLLPALIISITWMFIIMESQACTIDCGEKALCVEGILGADCSGFRGCHDVCPEGTRTIETAGKGSFI